LLNIDQFNMT